MFRYAHLTDDFLDRRARLRRAEREGYLLIRIACLFHENLPVYFTRLLTFPAVLFPGGMSHRAGGSAIFEECKQIVEKQGRLPTGKAVITTGGNLPAKYVIHTVGPIWSGGKKHESGLLASAYTESLRLAEKHNLKSISFPSISTGAYRYPLADAARIAIDSVVKFAKEVESIKEIVFVLFDASTYIQYENALADIAEAK